MAAQPEYVGQPVVLATMAAALVADERKLEHAERAHRDGGLATADFPIASWQRVKLTMSYFNHSLPLTMRVAEEMYLRAGGASFFARFRQPQRDVRPDPRRATAHHEPKRQRR